MDPLLLTQKGVRMLDRGRDPSAHRMSPFWTAVTAVLLTLVVLALWLLFA